MKPLKVVVVILISLSLSLVLSAQLPQKEPPKPGQSADENRIEAAHTGLFSSEDKAKEASRLTQSVAAVLPGGAVSYAPVARKNFIDEHIFGRMERDHIPHAPIAGDEEFLRRAYLDATGLLPTPEKVRSFLADTDPQKRDKLIDSLIGTEEFADQWAYHWGELLRTRESSVHQWTKMWLKADRPYNEVFYDIVTATTKMQRSLPTAGTFDSIGMIATRCGTWTDPDDYKGLNRLDYIDEITSDVGRVFLGISMDCFSCHNGAGHADSFNLFLAGKKRTDFWQQAAFFGKMRNIGGISVPQGSARGFYGGYSLFDDLAPGYNTGNDGQFYTPAEGRFPRDGKTYEPAFVLTGEKPKPGENPRKALGRILPSHIQFSRALVNIVWQRLMVIGLVEPYDGFDLNRLDPKNPPLSPWTIQPANPELLQALAEDFRNHQYSVQHVIKTIMKSNAYQLSTGFGGEWKDAYIPYYARRFARVLTGPEAVDLVAEATETPYRLAEFGTAHGYVKELTNPMLVRQNRRADATENAGVYAFMQAYYQQERGNPPQDKNVATPVQAMMMMTSPIITKRVSSEGSTRVANLLKVGKSDEEIVEELFLSSLTRRPAAAEMDVAKHLIAENGKQRGVELVEWVLLNSTEFLLNH